jgi:hypothetical protein
MHLDDVRIVTGVKVGCVVDGQFLLESPHYPGGDPAPSARERISFFMGGSFGAWLHLSELFEERPGFFSRASASNRLALRLPVDFAALLARQAGSPSESAPGYVEWAELSMESEFGWVSGRIPSLRVEVRVSEAGLGVSLSGEVGPLATSGTFLKPGSPVPVLADSRISVDIVILWAFLITQGSLLASQGNKFRTSDETSNTPFDFNRPGLSGVAFDRDGGTPFFEGRFAVQQGIGRPYVRAQIDDKSLVAEPCGHPVLWPDGFATRSPSDSAITYRLWLFGLGYDALANILSGETSGHLELKGDGVGYLTEATWLGSVAGRHVISACRIDLALGETELVVKIEGEVDRILQHDGPPLPPTLGPIFWVTIRIPVAFLAARNIDLLAWGRREKQALDPSRAP